MATVVADSASYADVSAAITAANAGDTVTVPAGEASWGSQLAITKGIQLVGNGIGSTIITSTYDTDGYLISYNPADYTLNTPFRLSGFTFDLDEKCGFLSLGVANKTAPFTVQDQIRIDHNRVFDPRTMAAQYIFNYCTMYGVVDNNSFEGGTYFFKNDSQGTESGWWATAPQSTFLSGTNNYLYFEDNTFALSGADNALTEGQYSGRYCFRYNDITGVSSYSLFELHGHQDDGDMGSCFGAEVYGNDITATGACTLFKVRGGRSFVFFNNVTGAGTYDNVAYTSLVTAAPVEPYLQMINDTYWFNNRKNLSGVVLTDDISGDITVFALENVPTAGRDIITDATTPGVTLGALASLPVTCAEHQGYWATAQTTNNLTGMVGIDPATPISGTLYKAVDTNTWEPFYTPYTYPHPLRGEGAGSDTLAVVSPNGGESWVGGTVHNITWTNTGTTVYENVKIQYSADSGATWTQITASTPNTGAYAWTVPNTAAATYLIKVSGVV